MKRTLLKKISDFIAGKPQGNYITKYGDFYNIKRETRNCKTCNRKTKHLDFDIRKKFSQQVEFRQLCTTCGTGVCMILRTGDDYDRARIFSSTKEEIRIHEDLAREYFTIYPEELK